MLGGGGGREGSLGEMTLVLLHRMSRKRWKGAKGFQGSRDFEGTEAQHLARRSGVFGKAREK